MRYYLYHQNNSGGYYTGPADNVIVRAASVADANALALTVGVDPDAPYCDCCGRRWDLLDSSDLAEGFDVGDTLADLAEWHDVDDALIVEAS